MKIFQLMARLIGYAFVALMVFKYSDWVLEALPHPVEKRVVQPSDSALYRLPTVPAYDYDCEHHKKMKLKQRDFCKNL